MKKFIKILIPTLLIILVVGTFVYLYKESTESPVFYYTEIVKRGNIEKSTVLTGDVEPRDEVLIKPRISGIISKLLKEPGDYVHRGDIIAHIKVIPDMQSLSNAESNVRRAEIDVEQAQKEYLREKQLYNEKLVSLEEFEGIHKAWLQAKEQLRAATDMLDIARNGVAKSNKNMSNTLVTSTLDGLVLEVPVKEGQSVIMSNTFNDGTTIASVANMNDLIFKGAVDETEVAMLHVDMPVTINIGALPGKYFDAKLEFIAPKVGQEGNNANKYEIRAAVNIPKDIVVRAGYSANATIALKKVENVLIIPEGALEINNGTTAVYILKDKNKQIYERREITTGLSDGVNIEVISGLKKGEIVRIGTPIEEA